MSISKTLSVHLELWSVLGIQTLIGSRTAPALRQCTQGEQWMGMAAVPRKVPKGWRLSYGTKENY